MTEKPETPLSHETAAVNAIAEAVAAPSGRFVSDPYPQLPLEHHAKIEPYYINRLLVSEIEFARTVKHDGLVYVAATPDTRIIKDTVTDQLFAVPHGIADDEIAKRVVRRMDDHARFAVRDAEGKSPDGFDARYANTAAVKANAARAAIGLDAIDYHAEFDAQRATTEAPAPAPAPAPAQAPAPHHAATPAALDGELTPAETPIAEIARDTAAVNAIAEEVAAPAGRFVYDRFPRIPRERYGEFPDAHITSAADDSLGIVVGKIFVHDGELHTMPAQGTQVVTDTTTSAIYGVPDGLSDDEIARRIAALEARQARYHVENEGSASYLTPERSEETILRANTARAAVGLEAIDFRAEHAAELERQRTLSVRETPVPTLQHTAPQAAAAADAEVAPASTPLAEIARETAAVNRLVHEEVTPAAESPAPAVLHGERYVQPVEPVIESRPVEALPQRPVNAPIETHPGEAPPISPHAPQPVRVTEPLPGKPSLSGRLGKWALILGGALVVAGIAGAIHGREDDDPGPPAAAEPGMSAAEAHHRAQRVLHRRYGATAVRHRASVAAVAGVVGMSAGLVAAGMQGRELFSRLSRGESIRTGANLAALGSTLGAGMRAWGLTAGAIKLVGGTSATERTSGVADIANETVIPSLATQIFAAAGRKTTSIAGKAAQFGTQLALAGTTSLLARGAGSLIDRRGGRGHQAPTVSYTPVPTESTDAVSAHDSPGDLAISMVSRDLPLAKRSIDRKLQRLADTGYAY